MKRRRFHRISIWLCYLAILGLAFDRYFREIVGLDEISICVLYVGLLMYALTLPYTTHFRLSLLLFIAATLSFLVMVAFSPTMGLILLFALFLLELSGFFRDPKEGMPKRKRNKHLQNNQEG